MDLAGEVVASADPGLAVGTQVLAHGHDLGVGRHGGFAAYARLPAGLAQPLPVDLTARQAMIIGTAGFTAALSVDRLEEHGLVAGQGPVLVTGASGGVGSFAVALLAGRGYDVVASTGKTDERPWLVGLGASDVIGRGDLDVDPGRVLGPERFAGAVDCVGGPTLAQILRTLRYGAAVAASGLTGGSTLETTVFPFITRDVALLGVDTVSTDALRPPGRLGRPGPGRGPVRPRGPGGRGGFPGRAGRCHRQGPRRPCPGPHPGAAARRGRPRPPVRPVPATVRPAAGKPAPG